MKVFSRNKCRNLFKTIFILLISMSLLIPGCRSGGGGSDHDNSNDNDNQVMSQQFKDGGLMITINNTLVDIYNQNITGKPEGSINIVGASCPLGGSVNITGTGNNTAGRMTVDLSYEMMNCKNIKVYENGTTVDLTITGTIEETGSFDREENFRSINYQSSSLAYNGTLKRSNYQDATVNETCNYSSTMTQNYTTTRTGAGSICSRTVTYSWTPSETKGSSYETDGHLEKREQIDGVVEIGEI